MDKEAIVEFIYYTWQYHEGVRAMWLAEKGGALYSHPYDIGAYDNLTDVSSPISSIIVSVFCCLMREKPFIDAYLKNLVSLIIVFTSKIQTFIFNLSQLFLCETARFWVQRFFSGFAPHLDILVLVFVFEPSTINIWVHQLQIKDDFHSQIQLYL